MVVMRISFYPTQAANYAARMGDPRFLLIMSSRASQRRAVV